METILIMCLGVLVGATVFPDRLKKWNQWFQTAATALLIFTMGVGLGSRPGFLAEIGEMGLESLVLALVPAALSAAVVYPLSRRFLEKKDAGQEVE